MAQPIAPQDNERLEALQECLERRAQLLEEHLASIDGVSENVKGLSRALNLLSTTVPHFRVGFYGPRGAGKTSLLNHILDKDLLPTSAAETATASITEVIAHRDANDTSWSALIDYITDDDWKQLVEQAQADVKLLRAESPVDTPESPTVQALVNAIKALQGGPAALAKEGKFPWEGKKPEELLTEEQRNLLRANFRLVSHNNDDDMKRTLEMYVSPDVDNVPKLLWPLVRKVTVWGPFPLLRQYSFSVLDIPGSEADSNATMTQRCLQGKEQCDRLYFLPDPQRVFNQATVAEIRKPEHLAFPLRSFGIILPRWKSSLLTSYKAWGDLDTSSAIEKAREKLANYAVSDDDKKVIARIPIYPVESAGEKRDSKLVELFVRDAITKPSEEADNHAVKLLLDSANATFGLLHHMVSNESNLPEALAAAVLVGRQQPAPVFDNATLRLAANVVPVPADVTLVKHNVQYNTLQSALAHYGGQYRAVDVPRELVAASVTAVAIDDLKLLLFNVVKQVREADRIAVLNKLQNEAAGHKDIEALLKLIGDMNVQADFHSEQQFFSNNLATNLANKLSRKYAATWATFRADGPGCLGHMRDSLKQWIQDHSAAVQADVNVFVEEHILGEAKRLQNTFLERFDFGAELAQVIPTMRANARLRQLLQFCTPITLAEVKRADFKTHLAQLGSWVPKDDDNLSDMLKKLQVKAAERAAPGSKLNQLWAELDALCDGAPMMLQKVSHEALGARTRNPSKEGVVYVITNSIYESSTLYKIGETGLTAQVRAQQLSKATGVPLPFEIKHQWATRHTIKFEKGLMHKLFDRVRINHSREFFIAPLPLIIQVGDIANAIIAEWDKDSHLEV